MTNKPNKAIFNELMLNRAYFDTMLQLFSIVISKLPNEGTEKQMEDAADLLAEFQKMATTRYKQILKEWADKGINLN